MTFIHLKTECAFVDSLKYVCILKHPITMSECLLTLPWEVVSFSVNNEVIYYDFPNGIGTSTHIKPFT